MWTDVMLFWNHTKFKDTIYYCKQIYFRFFDIFFNAAIFNFLMHETKFERRHLVKQPSKHKKIGFNMCLVFHCIILYWRSTNDFLGLLVVNGLICWSNIRNQLQDWIYSILMRLILFPQISKFRRSIMSTNNVVLPHKILIDKLISFPVWNTSLSFI